MGRVFVTGIGCVLPETTGRSGLEALAAEPRCLLRPEFLDRYLLAARVTDEDPDSRLSPRVKRRMNRIGIMATVAAIDAVQDAGRTPEDLPEFASIALGTGLGATESMGRFFSQVVREGPELANPLDFPTGVPNAIASQVAMHFRLGGPNVTVSQQEVSGEASLCLAVDWIAEGRSPLALVGGADEITLHFADVLASLGVLANPDVPRPFDRATAGAGISEGATFLVLEGEEGKDRAKAEVLAASLTAAPAPPAEWDETGAGLAEAIREVVDGAPDAVFVGASGHRAGDRAHAAGLAAALSDGAARTTAPKSMWGEGLSSGISQAALAILALETGVVPGTVGLRNAIPEVEGFGLRSETTKIESVRTVLSASTAIGGAAAAVLFGAPR